jgi:ERF superfamily
MHRSSESVAAIATALAKAQTELSNPEKAMVGTVYNNRADSPQSFRYASLSSGLDIIRKTLGGYQIAVAQTTDIDRVTGTVNLTTLLLHTSGEWISSDWPVCRLSETSAPRRMGAALTYARRYALFTIVGIAGEDDLDAPPDAGNDAGEGPKAATSLAGNPGTAPAPARPSQFQAGNGIDPPAREKLGAEESAAIRSQLIREIETLPEDDLQPRAIAILKAKNRLLADDAKQVEDAFATRMARPDESPEALAANEPAPAAIATAPAVLPSPDVPKRKRGHPRKIKTPVEETLVKLVPTSQPIKSAASGKRPATESIKTNRDLDATSVTRIDKSMLYLPEVRRLRDKVHLRFVALQPCLLCGRSPSDPHHLRFAQPRALGRKTSDEFTVPLCRTHHRQNHQVGNEVAWWGERRVEPIAVANRLWAISRGVADKAK